MSILPVAIISILLLFVLLLFVAMFFGASRFVLVATVGILAIMNNSYITTISESLGIGAPIILMSLIAVCLILHFRINLFIIPSYLFGLSGLFLALTLIVTILSVFVGDDIFRSSKAVISLAFVIFIGWLIFGKINKNNLAQSRNTIILICDILGFSSFLYLMIVIVFAGPSVWRGEFGGNETVINVFGQTIQRLQAEGFNATIVGSNSAIAIFWLFSVFQRNTHQLVKTSLIRILVAFSFLGLIWSGSRGAIIAFFATWIILRLILMNKLTKRKAIQNILGIIIVLGFACYFFINDFSGILYRGSNQYESMSFIDLFLSNRLDFAGRAAYLLFDPSFFGHGYGLLSTDIINGTTIDIESFFLRVWIELGVVGSFIYITTFIIITVYVIKVDRYFFLKGERGAFFPSAILLFTWLYSPTSFGFSLPQGVLAIQLAIASGALFAWSKIKTKNS